MKDLEKEILKIRVALEKETNKDIRKILLQQKRELENMRKEVGFIYMEYADDEGVLNLNFADKHNEMKKVEKDIVSTREKLAKATIAIARTSLLKSYIDSYYRTTNTINKGVEIGINYKLLRKEFVESVINAKFENMTYSDRIWKNTDKLANQLYDTIGNGITEGYSIQKMSKEIKNRFGVSSYDAKRLVQTESARISTIAQDNIYRDSGVVSQVMWCATLDGVCCDECASLDGQRFDINDTSKPMPPIHPNDRCCYIPVIENWNPKVRRDQDKKETIPYQFFTDWKKDNK